MALTQTWTETTPALREYGSRYRWTGTRCVDNRPVFEGDNGTRRCACDDH